MTDTIGAQYDQPDPRGWLVFHGLPAELQRAEDATQERDFRWAPDAQRWDRDRQQTCAYRAATAAEMALLAHLGYELPEAPATDDEIAALRRYGDQPTGLYTMVSYATSTLRCRRWPQLETTTEGNTTDD